MLVSHDVTAFGRDVDGSSESGALKTSGTEAVIGLVMAAGGTLASKFRAIIESLNVALGCIGCVLAATRFAHVIGGATVGTEAMVGFAMIAGTMGFVTIVGTKAAVGFVMMAVLVTIAGTGATVGLGTTVCMKSSSKNHPGRHPYVSLVHVGVEV